MCTVCHLYCVNLDFLVTGFSVEVLIIFFLFFVHVNSKWPYGQSGSFVHFLNVLFNFFFSSATVHIFMMSLNGWDTIYFFSLWISRKPLFFVFSDASRQIGQFDYFICDLEIEQTISRNPFLYFQEMKNHFEWYVAQTEMAVGCWRTPTGYPSWKWLANLIVLLVIWKLNRGWERG